MSYIFDGMEIPGAKVPTPHERLLKILMSPELGNSDKITLLFSIISPWNSTGPHTHSSDEIMYVASGRGEARVRDEKKELCKDFIIFAPRLVEHELKNTGDETLKLICIYVPPLKPTGYFEEAIKKAKEHLQSL